MTCQTSSIAVDIASDKASRTSCSIRRACRCPAPRRGRTADAAVEAARRLGYPVVVKPLDGNHGRGVALDLRRRGCGPRGASRRRSGESRARRRGRRDVRDRQRPPRARRSAGRWPRSPSGSRRASPATASTRSRQLVDIANADPRRGIGHEKVLTRITLDEAADAIVRAQGFGSTTCRPTGPGSSSRSPATCRPAAPRSTARMTPIRTTSRSRRPRPRWSGSTSRASTSSCPDIAVPVREQGGAIVEVNAAPGFRMHTHPTEGEPQYVAQPVIDLLFPPGTRRAHPDHRGDRHQRQDDDRPDDRPHPQAQGPARRADDDRRHRHRRSPDPEGRHERPESRRGWCSRTRPSTPRCSRSRGAGSCARAWATTATTSRSSRTSPATTSAWAASTRWASSPTSRA